MERPLAGKVAWVVGGSRGLGRAAAVRLAGEGARVLVTARGARALGDAVGEIAFQGGKAAHLVADARDADAMALAARHASATLGGLDLVIFAAASPAATPLLDGALVDLSDAVSTAVFGALHAVRAAAASLPRGGRFVAVVRAADGRRGAASLVVAGLSSLTRALAAELGPRGVTANLVLAGAEAEHDEVARVVAFVAGPGGAAVSGQVLGVG